MSENLSEFLGVRSRRTEDGRVYVQVAPTSEGYIMRFQVTLLEWDEAVVERVLAGVDRIVGRPSRPAPERGRVGVVEWDRPTRTEFEAVDRLISF